jgi:hypothetical protein
MKIVCFIILAGIGSAFAALPPLAQSTREMQALLSDPHMQGWLGSAEPIQSIIRMQNGYLIMTQNYAMRVDINYGGEDRLIGPVPFTLEFSQPVALRTTSGFREAKNWE